MKFKIVKSQLVEQKETHVYLLDRQQVQIIRIDGKPVNAVVRPGKLDKEGEFIIDSRQEALVIDIEEPRMKALIKVLKEVYGDI